MDESQERNEDRIQDLVNDIIDSGALGEPIGIPVGWVILISEWDPIANRGFTNMVNKRGQSVVTTRGMLEETIDRMRAVLYQTTIPGGFDEDESE